jgi:hypothetical protein
MLRAVPSIIFIAASSLRALMSFFLVCTICLICERVILPTFSRPAVLDPLARPAAFFMRTEAAEIW